MALVRAAAQVLEGEVMPPIKTKYETGVYIIRCLLTQKVYIGSAAYSFANRWSGHQSALRKNKHANPHLQAAWSKYGEEAFTFSIIERCKPVRCIEREQYWIDTLAATNSLTGYNIAPVAGNTLGTKRSPESIERIIVAAKKRGQDPEIREKIRAGSNTPEAKEKHRESCTRRSLTKQWREKCQEAAKEREANKDYTKIYTLEYRAKRSRQSKLLHMNGGMRTIRQLAAMKGRKVRK